MRDPCGAWPLLAFISQQSKQAPGQWPGPSIYCPNACYTQDRCYSDDLPKVAVISPLQSLAPLWGRRLQGGSLLCSLLWPNFTEFLEDRRTLRS